MKKSPIQDYLHRGTRLMEDAGFCKVRKGFHCRYHGWTYGIEEAPIEWWHEELNRRIKELT